MNRLIRVAPESPLRYTKLGQLHFSLFFLSIFSLVQGWFSMLGLAPPDSLREGSLADSWAWATAQWQIEKVPKRLNMRVRG